MRAFLVVAVVTMLFAVPAAAAAPQVLGLLATKVPQPLLCDDQECAADLASFCLQPGRGEPFTGEPYRAADPAGLTLVVTTAEGRKFSMPADGHLRFAANVAMTAVRVFVDRTIVDRLGATRLALQVEPGVSLLPIVSADDPDPLTPAEISNATGPARSMGAAYFEDGGPVGVTARLMTALLSGLPGKGRVPPLQRGRLWQDAIDTDLRRVSTAEGLDKARQYLEACRGALEAGVHYSLRTCLEARHGTLVRAHNDALRNALKAGW
jgi:hypothetical protein